MNLIEEAVAAVLKKRVPVPELHSEPIGSQMAAKSGKRAGTVSVAEHIVLALADRACGGDRGAAEVLYKIACNMQRDGDQSADECPVVRIRFLDGAGEADNPVDAEALAWDATEAGGCAVE